MASRAMRGLAWGVGGLALFMVLAAGFLVFIFDWNWLRAPLGERGGAAAGRGLAIEGDLHVDLGRTTHIRAEGVRLGNPSWAAKPDMAYLDAIDVSIRVWPLLKGRVEIADLVLTKPVIALEKNAEGKANWDFSQNPEGAAVSEAATPDERSEFPIIEHLAIQDGRLTYRDAAAGLNMDSTVSTAIGGDPSHERMHLEGRGTFKGDPAHLKVEAGSLLTLRETDNPYPLKVDLSIGGTSAHVDGTLQEPLAMTGLNLNLTLSGPDLAALYPITGVPLPTTAPYSIAGQLKRSGDNWSFTNFRGKVGDSDLEGGLTVATGGERNMLRANLLSRRLALADLAGFVGGDPKGGTTTAAPDRVLPSAPINLEKLRTMDVDVRFKGQQVEMPGLPMEALDAHLTIDDGLARLDPLAFVIAQGTFSGTVELNGRQKVPAVDIAMRIREMDLKRFFAGTRFEPESSGKLAGRVALRGKGNSTAEVLAKADGRATLMMSSGSFSQLLVEASGLDLAEALGFAVEGDKAVPVRCMVADWDIAAGQVKSKALVLDTTDTLLTGDGTIDLSKESMNLRFEAHPKDPSPLAARTPVEIGGTLGSPSVGLDPVAAGARVGIAAVLGVLLTPLAAIIPFLEPGLGEDSNCAKLMQQAQTR